VIQQKKQEVRTEVISEKGGKTREIRIGDETSEMEPVSAKMTAEGIARHQEKDRAIPLPLKSEV